MLSLVNFTGKKGTYKERQCKCLLNCREQLTNLRQSHEIFDIRFYSRIISPLVILKVNLFFIF
jgi:hypothetical protein